MSGSGRKTQRGKRSLFAICMTHAESKSEDVSPTAVIHDAHSKNEMEGTLLLHRGLGNERQYTLSLAQTNKNLLDFIMAQEPMLAVIHLVAGTETLTLSYDDEVLRISLMKYVSNGQAVLGYIVHDPPAISIAIKHADDIVVTVPWKKHRVNSKRTKYYHYGIPLAERWVMKWSTNKLLEEQEERRNREEYLEKKRKVKFVSWRGIMTDQEAFVEYSKPLFCAKCNAFACVLAARVRGWALQTESELESERLDYSIHMSDQGADSKGNHATSSAETPNDHGDGLYRCSQCTNTKVVHACTQCEDYFLDGDNENDYPQFDVRELYDPTTHRPTDRLNMCESCCHAGYGCNYGGC